MRVSNIVKFHFASRLQRFEGLGGGQDFSSFGMDDLKPIFVVAAVVVQKKKKQLVTRGKAVKGSIEETVHS